MVLAGHLVPWLLQHHKHRAHRVVLVLDGVPGGEGLEGAEVIGGVGVEDRWMQSLPVSVTYLVTADSASTEHPEALGGAKAAVRGGVHRLGRHGPRLPHQLCHRVGKVVDHRLQLGPAGLHMYMVKEEEEVGKKRCVLSPVAWRSLVLVHLEPQYLSLLIPLAACPLAPTWGMES